MWTVRFRFDLAEDDLELVRVLDADLEPWTDRWDRDTLVALLPAPTASPACTAPSRGPAAGRRAPGGCRRAFLRSLTEWLVDAAAPDPYVSGIPR